MLDLRVVDVGVDVPVLLGVVLVGVAVPDVAGVIAAELSAGASNEGGIVAVIVAAVVEEDVSDDGAVPPRRGERRCKVDEGAKPRSPTVLDGERWRPAWRSRTSVGRVVEAERKFKRSEIELDSLTFKGIVFPSLTLTNIWILSAGKDLEEEVEEDRERMVADVSWKSGIRVS